ncbi:5'-methylthioadenosine/S-adenosylhomocysteine nucleosidase family protein [Nitrosophilus labii]|uniref:5'-methylthioadenosine/S-adenosylhomocysteine nucleosidase family protein n=1 Tax=Nitrosophilus labii TaxID=2706014 RepID=UPI001656F462|nr:hypothetical protein [Nitrosophilus labii]
MKFITCSLYYEAKPFLEKFSLSLIHKKPFYIYKGNNIILVITGIGSINAATAVTYMFTLYPPTKKDTLINVGIAAGKKKFMIGEIVSVKKVIDKCSNKVYFLKNNINIKLQQVSCLTVYKEQTESIKYDIADMESSGIVIASKKFGINPIIFKIISDYFEPQKVSKENIYCLINNKVNIIGNFLNKL